MGINYDEPRKMTPEEYQQFLTAKEKGNLVQTETGNWIWIQGFPDYMFQPVQKKRVANSTLSADPEDQPTQ